MNFFGRQFDIDDLNHERRYAPERAYGECKLANILFTRELHRRHHAEGLAAVAFHPGVVRSAFASDTNHVMRFVYHSPLKYLVTISPERSARRLSWLVEGKPGVDWQPGETYAGRKIMRVRFEDEGGKIAHALWERSEEMLARVARGEANPAAVGGSPAAATTTGRPPQ